MQPCFLLLSVNKVLVRTNHIMQNSVVALQYGRVGSQSVQQISNNLGAIRTWPVAIQKDKSFRTKTIFLIMKIMFSLCLSEDPLSFFQKCTCFFSSCKNLMPFETYECVNSTTDLVVYLIYRSISVYGLA